MNTKEKVHKLRNKGLTIPEICHELDIKKGTVGFHLKSYKGKYKNKRKGLDFYVDLKSKYGNDIKDKYVINNNITQISKELGVSVDFIKKFLIEVNLYQPKNRKLDIKSLLKGEIQYKNPYYGSINGNIKKFIIKESLLKYECNICSLDIWEGKKLVLDLDHIDGNRNNNVLENLRFLCPNCHSQTLTYKGKNRK